MAKEVDGTAIGLILLQITDDLPGIETDVDILTDVQMVVDGIEDF